MSRIICISNRVSLPDPETGEIKAGGLAVGVKAGLESNGGGVWFGWDGAISKPDGQKRKITRTEKGDITFLTIPLREQEYEQYYKGMANEKLWPMMHGLGEYIEKRSNVFSTYRNVNKMFARQIKPYVKQGDLIWVHDYHLIPLGKELRALGVNNRIGYFHHIPMPSRDFVEGPDVPESLRRQYQQLLNDLFHYDLVGFQSFRDLKNFRSCIDQEQDCPPRYKGQLIQHHGRATNFGVFPISIETHELTRSAKNHSFQKPVNNNNCQTLIGAERLDYTKGLIYRLAGYYEFLDCHPEYWGKVQYQQITPLSRADIQQYKTAIENTRQIAREIKRDFGNEGLQPLVYSEDGLPREDLMGKMRHSDVGLVTPLIDGQNLVAKEYIASQNPRDPGMLVLSRNAGAAEELESLGVLCVDPTDPVDIADKIHQALNTPLLQRIETYCKAMSHLYRYDIEHWAESFLNELRESRKVLLVKGSYRSQPVYNRSYNY